MFAHSCFDILAIVLISSHGGSYLSLYVAASSVIDDILHMDTQFLIHMDYGEIVEEDEVHYQHTYLYQGLNVKEKIEEP